MRFNNKEELDGFRTEARKRFAENEAEGIKIFVGMGTCGIAAGAQGVYDAIIKELEKWQIKATVIQTGCIGMCVREPLVDIQLPGKDRVTYGNIKPEDVPRIIIGHILYGQVVKDLAVARFEEL